jgi:hypothetical protein
MDLLLGPVRDAMPPMKRERDPPWDRRKYPFLYDEQATRASPTQFSPGGPPRVVVGISAAYLCSPEQPSSAKTPACSKSALVGKRGIGIVLLPGLVSGAVFAGAIGVRYGWG